MKSAVAAASLASVKPSLLAAGDAPPVSREYYELRRYQLRRGSMAGRFNDYCREAAIPASTRAGVGPIGVFNVAVGPDNTTTYVLIPHPSLESLVTLSARLRDDAEYQKAGGAFINAPPSDPPYLRVESSLMVAFDGIPKLEVPAQAKEKQPRIFELRTYESHSKVASKTKIRMFNEGEIAIFRRTGITPVFFGETLVGARMPNLTYLVVFANTAEREKAWGAFRNDPEWHALRSRPEFPDAEIVSNISSTILRPTAYSQL